MKKNVDTMFKILLDHRMVAGVLLFLFVVSLLPILALAGVNCASGDDYGYGTLTKEAWTASHSMIAVFQAAVQTVKDFYVGWQGTWFTIFLFALQPAVFSPDAYVIVPWMMLFFWIGSTALLLHYLLVRICGFSFFSYVSMVVLFLMAGIQFIPSTKSGIFWYNGNAHYTMPYAMVLIAIYLCLRYIREGNRWAFVGMSICMVLLGGANYQAALLMLLLICSIGGIYFFLGKRKPVYFCMVPLLAEIIGLVISMQSPGNRARGGASFGLHGGQIVSTIFQSFVQAAKEGAKAFVDHPLLVLLFCFLFFIILHAFARDKPQGIYKYPGVAIVLSFCIYSAMYAPQIYAGVSVSGGVYNMNYLVLLGMLFFDLIYILGWWNQKKGERIEKKKKRWLVVAFFWFCMGYLLLFRGDIKDTTTWLCLEYQTSGQAESFRQQMDIYRKVLLDETLLDVVLPEVNDYQGPLMHMPLTKDPEAWTNTVMKNFYKKNSVTAVDGKVWNDLHGVSQ